MSQIPPSSTPPNDGYHPPKTQIAESKVAIQYYSSGGRLSLALHKFLNFIWSFTFGISSKTVSFSDWQQKKRLIQNLSSQLAKFSKHDYKPLLRALITPNLAYLETLFEKYPEKAPQYLASLNIKDFVRTAKGLNEQKLRDGADKEQIVENLSNQLAKFSKYDYKPLLQNFFTTPNLAYLEALFKKYPQKAPQYLASLSIQDFVRAAKALDEKKMEEFPSA